VVLKDRYGREHNFDNRYVVPHNTALLNLLGCHVCVLIVSSALAPKLAYSFDILKIQRYLYGYFAKGNDRMAAQVNRASSAGSLKTPTRINEISVKLSQNNAIEFPLELPRWALPCPTAVHLPPHGLPDR